MSLGFQNRHWSNSPNAIRVRVERLEFKLQVLNAYGGKCCCCGMNNPDMLSIDHIHGNGKVDRSIYGHFGRALYKHLRDNGYPKEDYRLLCYNCNEATHKLGVCPHEVCRLEAH